MHSVTTLKILSVRMWDHKLRHMIITHSFEK